MSLELALMELETETMNFNPDFLKDFITQEIMQANDQWVSCITSFAFVAIQRLIAHCKNHSIDPLEMKFEDIQKFMDDCLKKELFQEIKNPSP